MSKHLKHLFIAIGLAVLATSCGVEEFASKKKKDSLSTNPIQTNSTTSCSQFTYIKPKVDFLFLWDNSSSATFINDQTKQALNNTIDLISTRFDYHIVLSPLLIKSGDPVNTNSFLITSDSNPSSAIPKIDRSQAKNKLNEIASYNVAGANEYGSSRAINIINANKTTQYATSPNAFRREAHTVIVVMSTEDDDGVDTRFPSQVTSYVNTQTQSLRNIATELQSQQLRFFSIARKNICNTNYAPMYPSPNSVIYPRMSKEIFNDVSPAPLDEHNNQDSFDLCSISDFTRIFDEINNSILDAIVGHKYNYWPIGKAGDNIDPNEIVVSKNGVNIPQSSVNGFTFNPNIYYNQNTRYEPDAGEPYTGYLIQLHGDARVVYPECVTVKTQTQQEWYGYVHLQSKPVESSIQLKMNGTPVNSCGSSYSNCPSTCNGYVLMKSGGQPQYITNQNIRIAGPGNYTGVAPGQIMSGYFLKMCGNSVYSNGTNIEVIYDPSGS